MQVGSEMMLSQSLDLLTDCLQLLPVCLPNMAFIQASWAS